MLWRNNGIDARGRLTFTDVARETGTCSTLWGWAAKFADFDNDGREDIIAADGMRTGTSGNYVPVLGPVVMKPGFGARVTLRAGGLRLIREVNGGDGFESQSSTRLHFGLGAATRIDDLDIRWPSGLIQKLAPAAVALAVNRIYQVEEGQAVGLLQLSPVSGTGR
jgi:hypothetical protein